MNKMLPKLWYVNTINPEISKVIQEHLFSIGIAWRGGQIEVTNVHSSYLGVNAGFPYMTHGNTEFTPTEFGPYRGEYIKKLSVEEVLSATSAYTDRETISIGNATFYKDEFLEATRDLKSIDKNHREEVLPDKWCISVPTPEISRLAQEKIFEMGRGWGTRGEKEVKHTSVKQLGIDAAYPNITFSTLGFSSSIKKITLERFFTAKYFYGECETISIGDSEFYKDEFEEATKDLERVGV